MPVQDAGADQRARAQVAIVTALWSGRPPSKEQLATLEATGGRFLSKPYNRRGLIASLNQSAV